MVMEETTAHKIKLIYHVEVPKITCKKMLEHTSTETKLLKVIINKAVTSDVRITLFNP